MITILRYLIADFTVEDQGLNLMLGSSSIARLNHKKHIDCGDWLNRGIGSAVIGDLINYISFTPLEIKPTNILLYAGENDIGRGDRATEVLKEYKKLIDKLIEKYPSSKIHVISIKPSPKLVMYREQFRLVNDSISKYLVGKELVHIYFPDWDEELRKNVQVFKDDHVHLTEKGYDLFASEMSKKCKTQ